MTVKHLPVYSIQDFNAFSQAGVFYANTFKRHIHFHDFTNKPHKHDFYLFFLFTSGKGVHEVDFERYPVKPGSVFLLQPGQMHSWTLSKDTDGFVFFHTKEFYDRAFTTGSISDYPFYSSLNTTPTLQLEGKAYATLRGYLKEICAEYIKEEKLKFRKLHALVNLVYIELSRLYANAAITFRENYLSRLRAFETLIDIHFKDVKYARDYAAMMSISEKHLNRISQTCVHKTSSDLISARIILEAKRMLMHSRLSVKQVGDALGYKDKSYFTRFFKKHTGETPLEFSRKYLQ